jgi:type I restriction enzyme R subunit
MPPLGLGPLVRGARRNPNAIHIGLTATPRKLKPRSKQGRRKRPSPRTSHHRQQPQVFRRPVYEYTLIQAQEDGYLAACEIVKRKADIDARTFTRERSSRQGAPRTSRPASRSPKKT